MSKSKGCSLGRKRVVLTCLFVSSDEVYFCDFVYSTGKQLSEREHLYKALSKKRKSLRQPTIRVYQLKGNKFTDKEDFPVSNIYCLFNFCITANEKVIFSNPTLVNCIKDGNLSSLRKKFLDDGINPEIIDDFVPNYI